MRRALKFAIVFASALALSVVLMLLVFFVRPELLLNERVLGLGARIAAGAGVDLRWKDVLVAVDSHSFLEKRLKLSFHELCVRSSGSRGCFDDASASVAFSFKGLKPRISEIGPLRLLGGDISIETVTDGSGESEKPKRSRVIENPVLLPAWLSKAAVKPVRIELAKVAVLEKGVQILSGTVDLDASTSTNGQARVDMQVKAKPGRRDSVTAKLEMRNPDGFWSLDSWTLSSDASARLSGSDISLKALAVSRRGVNLHYDYRLNASYAAGRARINATADGKFERGRIETWITGSARNLAEDVPAFRVDRCNIKVVRSAPGSRIGLDCPVKAFAERRVDRLAQFDIPLAASAMVRAELTSSAYPPLPDSSLEGTVTVDLDTLRTRLLEIGGGTSSEVAGVLENFPGGWKLDTQLALKLRVGKFEALVKRLEGGSWAVPAPFHVLRGEVELGASGKVDLTHGVIPVEFKTRLASRVQRLAVDASGEFRYRQLVGEPRFGLRLDVVLNDVALELPSLEMTRPPKLLPDSRFVKASELPKKPEQPKEAAFAYTITVHTPTGRPVRILSNLAQAPIPVNLRLKLVESDPIEGVIGLDDFPVGVFRRKANVERFKYRLGATPAESRIDGLINVKYADYTVKILLLGTADKPEIRLTSDPPLPEDQLVATLLFGSPVDDLNPEQASSVGNVQAAVTGRALSLASLYALASTPVQSIGYDQRTGRVSAKVRLAEGTSLNVGASSSEIQEIGIRKRLGPYWTITTDLERLAETSGGRVISAFLEWSRRY